MLNVKEIKRGKGVKGDPMLNEEILLQIEQCVKNNCSIDKTAETVGIPVETLRMNIYRNVLDIRVKMQRWEAERMLKQAEAISDRIMTIASSKDDGTIDSSLLAIQQREGQFLREALVVARERYNKKEGININVTLPQPILGNILDDSVKKVVEVVDLLEDDQK